MARYRFRLPAASRRRRGGGVRRRRSGRRPRGLGLLVLLVALGVAALEGRESEVLRPLAEPFSRSAYAHWLDRDGDCRDTRQEILARDSVVPVRWSADGCSVTAGEWPDPYTGRRFTDPRQLDIDHVVPLAEAHRSGADRWEAARRATFANDPGNLVAVAAGANRSKGDGDPLAWQPPHWPYRCTYTARFAAIKDGWGLTRDPLEDGFTRAVLWLCDRL